MMPSRPGWISLLSALLLTLTLALAPSRSTVAAETLVVINQVTVDRFPEVTVYFTAVDSAGLPITDLSKDRVQVVHNGRSVPDFTLDLAEAEQDGLAVAVAIDTSGSMQGKPLETARESVRLLLERMGPRDRAALVSFGQNVQVIQDLTGDRDALNQALDGLVARGDTALYDGTFQAITLAARHALGRRSVVVITDGEDTHSSLTLDDVIGKARESNTPVSVIGLGEVKLEPVERLALVTGGSLGVAPDPDQLSERMGQVAERLRKQYVVRYRAPDSRPPENELELVVNQGGLQVRTAQRFPAPPMPPLAVSLADLTPGGTVRGRIELRPTILNTPRVDHVEYALDGAPLQTVTDAPYVFSWDTSTVPPGQHTLTVKARLGDQEAEQSLPLTVVPAIQLSIKLPAGQDVSGWVKLQVELDAPSPVAGVEWAIDGKPIGTAVQPPFEIEWDSTGLPAGEHIVTVQAKDERGNVGQASQTVRVLPAVPGAGPTTAAGTPGSDATARPGETATPAGTPTATSTSSSGSGILERISPAVWIGIAAVIAIVGGLIYAASRRRNDGVIEGTAFRPGQDGPASPSASQMALPGARRVSPTHPGLAGSASDDFRGAETMVASVLPGDPAAPAGGPGQASVTVVVAGSPPRSWPLGIDQIVGRAAGPGVIVIADPRVSRRHARISWESGHFVYRDLGPMNPTRREGRTLPNPYILRDGDRLHLGRAELTFRA
jgi:VWFA-related protein